MAPDPIRRATAQLSTLIALATPLFAQSTIRVPSDQPTIQAGIDAAAPGDVVLIEPGQYAVSGLSTGGKELTLRGEAGADQTVLDGALAGTILFVQNGEGADLVLDGLTFFRGLSNFSSGGAIDITGNASPTIQNCVFDRNEGPALRSAVHMGGSASASIVDTAFIVNGDRPLSIESTGTLSLLRCSFADNVGDENGIDVSGGGSLVATDCTFERNQGSRLLTDSAANSITLRGCDFVDQTASIRLNTTETVLIEDCRFENRPSSSASYVNLVSSGAVVILGTDFVDCLGSSFPPALNVDNVGSYLVEDCSFRGNRTGSGSGGGAAWFGSGATQALVRRCTFIDNSADSGGGAVQLFGNARIENSAFLENSAGTVGGAILASTSGASIDHCTFVGNTAEIRGGAIFSVGSLEMRNSIIWGNAPDGLDDDGSADDVQHSLVQGGYAGLGNLDVDPLLAQGTELGYSLSASSPCRDAGVPGEPLPGTDLGGDPRLIGDAVDMGADEILEQPYPGTGEDLRLTTLVDGGGNPLAFSKSPAVGSSLTVRLDSPAGSFVGSPFLLFADFGATGVPLPPSVIQGVDLDVLSPQFSILFDSANVVPELGGLTLSPLGFAVDLEIPSGLGGLTFYLQGTAIVSTAANGAFAVSNAHEVVLP